MAPLHANQGSLYLQKKKKKIIYIIIFKLIVVYMFCLSYKIFFFFPPFFMNYKKLLNTLTLENCNNLDSTKSNVMLHPRQRLQTTLSWFYPFHFVCLPPCDFDKF